MLTFPKYDVIMQKQIATNSNFACNE